MFSLERWLTQAVFDQQMQSLWKKFFNLLTTLMITKITDAHNSYEQKIKNKNALQQQKQL
jgi:hypothetical protein